MAGPRDDMQPDPERTPFTTPAPRFTYIEHPIHGRLMVNSDTWVVTPIPGKPPYPGFPLALPTRTEKEKEIAKRIKSVPQPHIRLCGLPGGAGGTHGERGCETAIGNGCPILLQYGRVGPVNMILEKHGHVNSFPCYMTYCGITPQGRPTSQAHYLGKGWRVVTDRTTITENIRDPQTRREYETESEVPDLAPFYDKIKREKAAKAAMPEPKKRGRPRKNAHREDLGAGVQTAGL